jgi:hypothetical protein
LLRKQNQELVSLLHKIIVAALPIVLFCLGTVDPNLFLFGIVLVLNNKLIQKEKIYKDCNVVHSL